MSEEEAQLESQQEQPVEQPTEQSAEPKVEPVEEEVSEEEEAKEKLPFPTATIVRLMRAHLDKDKIIKKDVKIGMNKWLGSLVSRVSKDLNKIPYTTLHLHEFRESIKVYLELQVFYKEKERILAHLDAIKKDIQKLERDLGKEEEGQLMG